MKLFLLALVLPAALGAFHAAPPLPAGWARSAVLFAEDQPLSFVVTLREDAAGVASIKETALAVSDPDSPAYGNFLTSAEIAEAVAPSQGAVDHVTTWLRSTPGVEHVVKSSRVEVRATAVQAAELFSTTFSTLWNEEEGSALVRAGGYQLPAHIEELVAAVFGLHGLPLPRGATPPQPSQPASVTPAVIEKVYSVGGVSVKPGANKQAVAEFQGQTMSAKDLSQFFAKYVKNYTVGTDDTVSKFVGDKDTQQGQTEASLDIQYMMGVSPGIKSEFWLYNNQDFCGDLANWTATILADDDAPLVHSVSYGWQGDLSALHCENAKVAAVDAAFAKLAAKGISIIFASGDSGSGYKPSGQCNKAPTANTALTGDIKNSVPSPNPSACCQAATGAAGWTFSPNTGPPTPAPAHCGHLPSAEYFKGNTNKTAPAADADACCSMASSAHVAVWTFTPAAEADASGQCILFSQSARPHGNPPKGTVSGFVMQPRPPMGNCTVFSKITGKTAAPKSSSGTTARATVVLWSSWPASSGWVTSVGATRFVGHIVGAEQMATDQFGSGGGFSRMFNISTDATWQADAVKAYLAGAPQLPPSASFPAGGRATPDVSALGEGYQVLQAGKVAPVGGTSASTPAFSGLISLINEARLQAGKKQMGFLNPWIYKNTAAFTDITKGSNAIGRGTFALPYGFNCTSGWDPVTGVGTPIFDKMLAAAMQ